MTPYRPFRAFLRRRCLKLGIRLNRVAKKLIWLGL